MDTVTPPITAIASGWSVCAPEPTPIASVNISEQRRESGHKNGSEPPAARMEDGVL